MPSSSLAGPWSFEFQQTQFWSGHIFWSEQDKIDMILPALQASSLKDAEHYYKQGWHGPGLVGTS